MSVYANLIYLCFLCLLSSHSYSAETPTGSGLATQKLYLALPNKSGNSPQLSPTNSFDCTDKIFAVLETEDYNQSRHQALFKWVDPYGKTRERVNIPFFVNSENTRIWSWLQLKRGAGAGILQFMDSSAGLEEFIGEWKIEVWINDKKQESVGFEISC